MINVLKVDNAVNFEKGNVAFLPSNALTIPMMGGGNGYYVRNVEGLTPPPVVYESRNLPLSSNHQFENVQHDIRQLILTLGFDSLYGDVGTLRRDLYRYFSTGQTVRMTFETSYGDYWIEGVVKNHESNVFSMEPLSQITIECENPYFKRLDPIVIEESGLSSRTFNIPVVYPGDVPSGFSVLWVGPNSTTYYAKDIRVRSRYDLVYISDIHLRGIDPVNRTNGILIDSSGPVKKLDILNTNGTVLTTRFLWDNIIESRWPLVYPRGTNVLTFNFVPGSSSVTNLGTGGDLTIEIPVLMVGL